MIAAIYARKSTEQNGVADDQKSVARQIEQATTYATRKGWTVRPSAVYVDDGISGAEFSNRPGFLRLMNALKPKPAFHVLIMSEESRLGREAIETAYALKQIVQANVRVFFYLEDRERTLDSPTDKIMLSLTAFADELEREKARQRTYDAMQRKARAGHVTGGRVFGYDNADVMIAGLDGLSRRSHVERHVNEAEAAVVRRMFALASEGRGVRAIAKTLNQEGAPCPRSQRGRPRSWAPSSVRSVLYRSIYRGEITWNKTRKRDQWGQKHATKKAAAEWYHVEAPALRVVPEALWLAAHERLGEARGVYLRGTNGRLWGRPQTGIESKYLLPGLAKCSVCGGGLIVRTRPHGRTRTAFYACGSYHYRGDCTNSLEVPMARVDEAVLAAIESRLFGPGVVEDVLADAMRAIGPAGLSRADEAQSARAGVDVIDAEIERLTEAIAQGGHLPSLVLKLKTKEQDRDALRARVSAATRATETADTEPATVRAALEARFADWRGVLRRQIPQARQILKKLLVGALSFTPQGTGREGAYLFAGEASLTKMLACDTHPFMVASPPGFEPGFWP